MWKNVGNMVSKLLNEIDSKPSGASKYAGTYGSDKITNAASPRITAAPIQESGITELERMNNIIDVNSGKWKGTM
jgi:phenylalanyl-tRNA synthetase beta subunit